MGLDWILIGWCWTRLYSDWLPLD